MTKKLICGVDIGGTNTQFGFVDSAGTVHGDSAFETNAQDKPDQLFDRLCKEMSQTWSTLDMTDAEFSGIGIGAPNANYHTGKMHNPPNFKHWDIVDVVGIVKSNMPGKEVAITNDANAAAMGEMTFGKAKGKKDFILITLGTGLGSGIVSGGQLVLGHDGFAGEMGHMVAVTGSQRECGCGKKGCLETYASATGIVRTARKMLMNSRGDSQLRHIPTGEISSKDVGKAAAAGDKLALDVLNYTGKILGVQLANAVAILSPESIYIFGGPANDGELITKPIIETMNRNLLNIFRNNVSLEISGLQNKNAAVLGAASLVANW